MSFRNKLFILFASLAVMMVAASMLLVNVRFRHYFNNQIVAEMQGAHHRFDAFQQERMRSLISLAANISADFRLRGSVATADISTIKQAVNETYLNYPTDLFWVLNQTGLVLVMVDSPQGSGSSLADLPVVKDAMNGFDSGDIWVRDGRLYQVAAVPILSGPNQSGILLVGYRFDHWLTGEFRSLTGAEIAFLGSDGPLCASMDKNRHDRFIAAIEELRNGDEWPQGELPAIPALDAGQPGAAPVLRFALEREPFAGALFEVHDSRNANLAQGLAFRSILPEEELAARIQVALLGVGLAAVLVSLTAAYLLARGLTGPIKRLVSSSKQLGSGDLDVPVQTTGRDEIGVLAGALEEMRKSLKSAREDLIRNERLSTIGRMASGILHDFRQPITAVYGYMDMLAMNGVNPETRHDFRDRAARQIDNMLAMVNELLDFARGEVKLNLEPVQMSRFCGDIRDSFEHECRARAISLRTEYKWDGSMEIDAGRMRRAVENLVRNAIQAIGNNGAIHLATEMRTASVIISVKDNGPGIPQDIIGRLFEPFFSHGKKEGTGLGLAMVKKVVEEHGGAVRVAETSDKGTTFEIHLPVKVQV